MQRITFFSLALITGFCLQPLPLIAQDQETNPKDTKGAEGAPHAAREKPKAVEQDRERVPRGDLSRADKSQDKAGANSAGSGRRSMDNFSQKGTGTQSVQQTGQGQTQSTAFAVQGNRSNRYNGRWVAGSAHGDWDRTSNHEWNNNNYRWYDGGWLIIEPGASPGYYETGSMVIRVKQSLAQQGYYRGHFTERIGPHTRQAISNYESDKGLQVNGQIDGPLLASLGLE
jgi:hypothetical protein